jgi:hypothetical protein
MTARHSPLFTLRSGQSGLGIYTSGRDAACRNRQILPFHTHLHLGELPSPLNHQWYLQFLLTQKVAPRVQKLLKTTTKNNEGVVVKPWNREHHGFYNIKDYYKYKHHQDSDLVLDYRNSDLRFTK